MSFLKAHGRFLVVLLAVLAVAGYGHSELDGLNDAVVQAQNGAKSTFGTQYRQLFEDAKKYDGRPATVEGVRLAGETQRMEELEQLRAGGMQWQTAPEFSLSALPASVSDDDKLQYFYDKLIEVKQELGYARYFVPDVGSDEAFGFNLGEQGVQAAEVEELLAKLDMVLEIGRCVERTNVQFLDRIEFPGGRGEEAGAVLSQLSRRGLPVTKARDADSAYFKPRSLRIEFRGSEAAVLNLLLELQRPEKAGRRNRYLSIEEFSLDKPDLLDPADDLVLGKATLVAWTVHLDAELPPAKGQSGGAAEAGPARGPRRFR